MEHNSKIKRETSDKRTDVLGTSQNVSRETTEYTSDNDVLFDEKPEEIESPGLRQLYRRFRDSSLSRVESAFNALYLYCNNKYYSSGAHVKDAYKNIYAHPDMWYKNASSLWRHNKWSLIVAVLDIVPNIHKVGHSVKQRVKSLRAKIKGVWRNFEYSYVAIRSIGKIFRFIAVYGLSLVSLVLCIMAIGGKMSMMPMLGVYLDGEYVGNALGIAEVESAQNVFDERMTLTLGKSFRLDSQLEYKPTFASTSSQLTHNSLNAVFDKTAREDMMVGYGLYIDGALIGVSEFKSWIDEAINDSLELKKVSLRNSGIDVDNVTYYNNVTTNSGMYPSSLFLDLSEVRKIFGLRPVSNSDFELLTSPTFAMSDGAPREHYIDSPIVIDDTLDSENDVSAIINDLDSGDVQVQGFTILDVVVEKTETIIEEIPFDIIYEEDPELVEGREKITIRGVTGKRQVVYNVGYVGDKELRRTEVSQQLLSQPKTQVVKIGTRPMTEEEKRVASTGTYIWPYSPDKISSHYGWRTMWGSNEFHKGLDICGPLDSDIVASDGGEVIKADYDRSGYGECIIILHDDGTKTRYAHCSQLYVVVGQKVAQGEVIAGMGMTGSATGVHVHFEIIKDGVIQNPEDYLP